MLGFNELLGILGLVVGVIGIPVGIFIGRRNRQKPDLRVLRDFVAIKAPSTWAGGDLKLSYKGTPLDRVSRTHIAIWNHRGDTITADDVVARDPLRVEVSVDDQILQAGVEAYSREPNDLRVEITPDGRSANISFDFLDAGDGGVVYVLHRGKSPANLVGTVRGAKPDFRGAAELTRGAREAVRLPRLRRYTVLTKRSRSGLYLSLAVIVLAIAATGVGIWLLSMELRTPMLVNAYAYDLDTVEGQAEFAKRVRDVGATSGLSVALAVSFFVPWLLLLVMAVRRLLRATRAVVPRSVVAEESTVSVGIAAEITSAPEVKTGPE